MWWIKFCWWIVLPCVATILNIHTGLRDGVRPMYLYGTLSMAFILGMGCERYRLHLDAFLARKHEAALTRAAEEECVKDWMRGDSP